jgi:hypothetical protein
MWASILQAKLADLRWNSAGFRQLGFGELSATAKPLAPKADPLS